MKVIYDATKQKVPIKSWCKDVEESAMEQAINLSNHPAIFKHIALMPDVHAGMGMPIGGVVALNNAISPNMIGSDIGCGMCTINTGLKVEDVKPSLKGIMEQIKRDIPVGFSHNKQDRSDTLMSTAKNIVDKFYEIE